MQNFQNCYALFPMHCTNTQWHSNPTNVLIHLAPGSHHYEIAPGNSPSRICDQSKFFFALARKCQRGLNMTVTPDGGLCSSSSSTVLQRIYWWGVKAVSRSWAQIIAGSFLKGSCKTPRYFSTHHTVCEMRSGQWPWETALAIITGWQNVCKFFEHSIHNWMLRCDFPTDQDIARERATCFSGSPYCDVGVQERTFPPMLKKIHKASSLKFTSLQSWKHALLLIWKKE